jgi:hypothetical protein
MGQIAQEERVERELLAATRSWLEYLRDEGPALSAELEPQTRFVVLLDYHSGTWFKRLLAE